MNTGKNVGGKVFLNSGLFFCMCTTGVDLPCLQTVTSEKGWISASWGGMHMLQGFPCGDVLPEAWPLAAKGSLIVYSTSPYLNFFHPPPLIAIGGGLLSSVGC
ncbi:hypothetical protein SEVIR_9G257714v4 [Setaria viridis]